MGMKGPDMIAAFACSSCHGAIDGRSSGKAEEGDLIRALAETQLKWLAMGLITIKGMK